MRLFTKEHVYDHPWDTVTLAHWNKFPNTKNNNVLDVNTLEQRVDTDGRLHTVRLFQCLGATPGFMKVFLGNGFNYAWMIEKAVCDANKKKLVFKSHNISFSKFLEVTETCTYESHPTDPSKTVFRQEAVFHARMPALLGGKAEGWGISNMDRNSPKGLEVIEELCRKIHNDGHESLLLG
jgi:hypothetical protein